MARMGFLSCLTSFSRMDYACDGYYKMLCSTFSIPDMCTQIRLCWPCTIQFSSEIHISFDSKKICCAVYCIVAGVFVGSSIKWKCEERTISSEPLKNPTLWRRELNKTNWNLMVLLTYEQSRKNLSTWIIAPLGIVPANWKLATSETDKQCNRPQFITIFQIGPNAIAISLSYIISTYTPRRIAYFVGAILCCVKWLDSSFVRFIFLEFHLSSYSIALVMRKAVNNLRSE